MIESDRNLSNAATTRPIPTLFWHIMACGRYNIDFLSVSLKKIRRCGSNGKKCNFNAHLTDWYRDCILGKCLHVNATEPIHKSTSRDNMAAIFQTTFSNGFSWMKMYEFRLKFHWSLFLGVQLTIFQHRFRQWLGADQAASYYLNQWWSVYWHTCVTRGFSELTRLSMMTSSNGNIFRVTGHLCGKFTGPRWIPRTKASDAELWCFLWSASE